MMVQATPLGAAAASAVDKENNIMKTSMKKTHFLVSASKTPLLMSSKSQVKMQMQTDRKAGHANVERLRLAEVRNGTPGRAVRLAPIPTAKPTNKAPSSSLKPANMTSTVKKNNLRVWRDLDSAESKSTERSSVKSLKPAKSVKNTPSSSVAAKKKNTINLKSSQHQSKVAALPETSADIRSEAVVAIDDTVEIEYCPPNTLDKLVWTPDDAQDFDISSWDLKMEAPCKPYVSRATRERVEKVKKGFTLAKDFLDSPTELSNLVRDGDFNPSLTMDDIDEIASVDFHFDLHGFHDLVVMSSLPKARKKQK